MQKRDIFYKHAKQKMNEDWSQFIRDELDAHQSAKAAGPNAKAADCVDPVKKAVRTAIILREQLGICSRARALNDWHAFCKLEGFDPCSDEADTPKAMKAKGRQPRPGQ